jgi:hypothetical protein
MQLHASRTASPTGPFDSELLDQLPPQALGSRDSFLPPSNPRVVVVMEAPRPIELARMRSGLRSRPRVPAGWNWSTRWQRHRCAEPTRSRDGTADPPTAQRTAPCVAATRWASPSLQRPDQPALKSPPDFRPARIVIAPPRLRSYSWTADAVSRATPWKSGR